MISLKSLNKHYPDFGLFDINLEIHKGEYFVILGPSGAGKTVILELLAGLITPDSGTITGVQGKSAGLIYQDYMLFPHLNVYENVGYGLKIRKIKKTVIKQEVTRALERLGISSLIHRDVTTLSGGEKQRVAIARAMVIKPDIYLLDEPTAALDLNNKYKTQRLFLELHKADKPTIIHVTHDFEEALALGDRIAIIKNGKILQVDVPDKIFLNPENSEVADFLGYKNIFSGIIKNHNLSLKNISITTPVESADHAYVAVRSNDIILSKEKIDSSARNSFQGIITHIMNRGSYIEVTLDAGVLFHIDITVKSYNDMNLLPGDEFWATFKTQAVKVFSH
ncbi:MAG: ABC transporter ATP-binding protein [Spirochaetales bacterium]|nr:ABC transporter ATP-binding protein [Spirochaetales bacterium]